MNILVVGKFQIESFESHIYETLEYMGHDVSIFNIGYSQKFNNYKVLKEADRIFRYVYNSAINLERFRSFVMRDFWNILDTVRFDLIIVCHDYFWPQEVQKIKDKTNSFVVLWFPDPIIYFGKALFMNASYDALFFKDPYIIKRLKKVLTTPIYYLPECFNPKRHYFHDEINTDSNLFLCDIVTAGNLHSWRVAFFSHLLEYDLKIWGHPAPPWLLNNPVLEFYKGKCVYNQEKAHAFKSAKIVINNLTYGEIWGVNVRCFETAGIGAFQMVDDVPGIDHLFQDGKEIITYDSINDLKEKIDYWLPRDEERKIIAQNGMKRAFLEHTYSHRLQLMIDTIFGISKGFEIPDILK